MAMPRQYSLLWRSIKQAADTKASRKMECEMGKGNFSTKMAAITTETGKTIRCMDGENYSMKAENWPTKEIGRTTNFTVTEKFTTIILCPWTAALITLTSTYWTTTGNFTKACWQMIQRKAEDASNSRMMKFFRATSILIGFKALVNFSSKMGL